ncbi:MAG: Sbal_3080 family lipoprotein [Lautropia sp.]|nr:Sbal_3080 family lipoprotein [Lautropia sp.]
MKKTAFIASTILIAGCSTINNVTPASKSENIQQVCIVNNPKVKYSEAQEVIREGFGRRGISTTVVKSQDACPISLTYTARRSWHFASYLGRFEMHLWKDGIKIASAEYAQRHWDPTKWGNTRGRMEAMVNKLLADYPVLPPR